MEDRPFDQLVRSVADGTASTRRGVLTGVLGGLLGGLLAPVLPGAEALARNRRGAVAAETWQHKRCPAGWQRCTVRKGRKKKGRCVDVQSDPANCGACRHACGAGQTCAGGVCAGNVAPCAGCLAGSVCAAGTTISQCGAGGAACQVCAGDDCNEPACDHGVCGTTPLPGESCNDGAGTCDASGRCQPQVCIGKTSSSPCFPEDASTCNAGGSTCRCGVSIEGINGCYEDAYCAGPTTPDCTSNADCEATFGVGSLCFADAGCCGGWTGCTSPCPNPVS